MKSIVAALICLLAIGSALGCGASAAPVAPTSSSTGTTLNLTGTWTGTGSDRTGDEALMWTVTQSGTAVTGTVNMSAFNAPEGSCAFCHKHKIGTLTGTVSPAALSMKIVFPGGDAVETPICVIKLDATATNPSNDRFTATYTGDDTCEGSFTDGSLTMTRRQ